MSLVHRVAGDLRRRDTPATQGGWLRSVMAGWGDSSYAGKVITPGTALGLPAFFSGVRLLAEGVGSLPLLVYVRRKGGGRQRAPFETAYRLLHDQPNPEMPPMVLWTLVMVHLLTWGEAYLGKQFTKSGKIVEALWPIRPELVRRERRNGVKTFWVRQDDGTEKAYTADSIIHIPGISLDGWECLSPVALQRQALGVQLGLQEHVGKLFANRAVPAGVISVKKRLSTEAAREMREKWDAIHKGSGRAHRIAVLDEEAVFNAISMPLEDMQFIELAKLGVQDIARMLRLPASMLDGESGSSMTYSNVESDAQALVTHSFRTWTVRIEQSVALDRDLFPQTSLYPEFLLEELLRGDTNTRFRNYSLALNGRWPWMRPSEVRERENLPADPSFDDPPAAAAPPPTAPDTTPTGGKKDAAAA